VRACIFFIPSLTSSAVALSPGCHPSQATCTEAPGILPGFTTTCCCAAAQCLRAPQNTFRGASRSAWDSWFPVWKHAAASAASEGLRWAKSPATGWREPANMSRGPIAACIQPPYRHRGGCNSVAAPWRCPIARTCCHEPNCRLQARPSPSYPYLLHRQPFATNRTQTRSIMHPQPRKCTQQSKVRTRNGSQYSYAKTCTSHSHAKTHAMPLTIARSHTSSHSFARKLALTIHESVNLQARLFVKSQSTIVPRPPTVTGWSRSQKH
jgi:hypothetical protein